MLLNNLPGGGGSGSWVKISTKTAANSANITFTDISNTFPTYILMIRNLVPVSASSLVMRTSSNNGTSYDSGASDYFTNIAASGNGSWAGVGDATGSSIQLSVGYASNTMTTNVQDALTSEIRMDNLGSASYAFITGIGNYKSSSYTNRPFFRGYRQSTTAINAISLFMTSGNISSGTFTLSIS